MVFSCVKGETLDLFAASEFINSSPAIFVCPGSRRFGGLTCAKHNASNTRVNGCRVTIIEWLCPPLFAAFTIARWATRGRPC
jgi:hypothetical protein